MIGLIPVRRDVLRDVYDVQTARAMGGRIYGHMVALCKFK